MLCSVCLLSISSTSFKVFICFIMKIFLSQLSHLFSSTVLIPRIMYADSTINHDEDDDLIDPGCDRLIDHATDERLDGQFEDITSSTRIIQ